MKWTLIAVPLAAFSIVAWQAPAAMAQEHKTARGTVTAVSGDSVSVKVGDQDMKFAVDKDTRVITAGGGTKTRKAQAAGAAGVKVADVLKVGQAVEVTYGESGGTMQAIDIRTMAKVPAAGASATAAPAAKTAAGTVKDVSATSLTITDKSKDLTFSVDNSTRVIGKGAGTKAKAGGGKIPITDLVASGDQVSVTYHETDGAMHAASVRVVTKASIKK